MNKSIKILLLAVIITILMLSACGEDNSNSQSLSSPLLTEPKIEIPTSGAIENYEIKDNLVKDTKTGLMWMRCSLGQNWNGSTCQGQITLFSLTQLEELKKFNYAGYMDWRLPTKNELRTIVLCDKGHLYTHNSMTNCVRDDERAYEIASYDEKTGHIEAYDPGIVDFVRPTIHKIVFPETPIAKFWSSSSFVVEDSGEVLDDKWAVDFDNGGDTVIYSHLSGAVRLVRTYTNPKSSN